MGKTEVRENVARVDIRLGDNIAVHMHFLVALAADFDIEQDGRHS